MELTVAQLAERVDAVLRGDGQARLTGIATLQRAGPGELTFLANPKYGHYLSETRAGAVILKAADADRCPVPVLISDDPYACYARAAQLMYPPAAVRPGIHASAAVSPSAQIDSSSRIDAFCTIDDDAMIGPRVHIGPGSIIGAGVRIGADSRLVAGVTVLARALIGERVLLHPGVVIGADGFGLAQVAGRWEKIPQLGSVVVGDDVEIGANTSVDRGTLDDTVIAAGVKIDNQVQIAHNVVIGEHTAIAGCVGISGSTRIGRHCTLAGGVGLVGHIELADHVHVTAMSLVSRSIREAGRYSSGTPLMENLQWRRNSVCIRQLRRLLHRVSKLEKNSNYK